MAKEFRNMVFFISGVYLILYFMGIVTVGPDENAFLSMLLTPNSMSDWVLTSLLIGGLGTISGIVVGIVTRDIRISVYSGFIIALFGYISTGLTVVYIKLASINFILATIFFGPLAIYMVLATIDWWGGTD